LAIVTNVGRDAMDAKAPKDERRLCLAKPFWRRRVMRTAKSCGPDASTLAFNLVTMLAHRTGDGGKKADHQGEHEGSR
jgi:hypothetical protein